MIYTREEFVKKYGPYIIKATRGTGILPGTLIAQAIIESQGKVNGVNYVGGSGLSRNANNYFGIKCHKKWTGLTYNADTNEQTGSGQVYVEQDACFRRYRSVKDSIDDYIKFLKSNPTYTKHGVFKAKTVKDQAQALKNAGYATAVDYANTIYKVYSGIKEYLDDAQKRVRKQQSSIIGWSIASMLVVSAGIYFLRKRN